MSAAAACRRRDQPAFARLSAMGSFTGNLLGRWTPTGTGRQRIEAVYERAARATAARSLQEALELLATLEQQALGAEQT